MEEQTPVPRVSAAYIEMLYEEHGNFEKVYNIVKAGEPKHTQRQVRAICHSYKARLLADRNANHSSAIEKAVKVYKQTGRTNDAYYAVRGTLTQQFVRELCRAARNEPPEGGEAPGLPAKGAVMPPLEPDLFEFTEEDGDGPKRVFLTSAQNNTTLHEGFWHNLNALADFYSARIAVSRFTYNKAGSARTRKPGSGSESDKDDLWYDPRIASLISDADLRLSAGSDEDCGPLVWFGSMNIIPTATKPLSGMESHSRMGSGVYPHPKVALDSLPRMKGSPPRFGYTTGCITTRNYIARKEGQKASFHHSYGALLVEVMRDGRWWARQVLARDEDGTINDLDLTVENGKVSRTRGTEFAPAATLGDIHFEEHSGEAMASLLGEDGLLALTDPSHVFVHDVFNHGRRSHHDRKNHIKSFILWKDERDSVEEEVEGVIEFLQTARDRNTSGRERTVIVVDSNHDRALGRWLAEADYRADPPNARFFLSLQERRYALANSGRAFHALREAVGLVLGNNNPERIAFLLPDESYMFRGIEMGMHGDLGANGSRGSAASFAKMGAKANVGHSHSARIHEGVYQAGTTSELDLGYNAGPTTWSHSHILTYWTGKRSIITSVGELPCAPRKNPPLPVFQARR